MSVRGRAVLAVLAVMLVAAGCGGSEDGEPTTSDVPRSWAGTVILSESEGPDGYAYGDTTAIVTGHQASGEEDSSDVLAQIDEVSKALVTEPAQCAALVPNAGQALMLLTKSPEGAAAADFMSTDEDAVVVTVMIDTTDVLPALVLDGCEDFTQTNGTGELKLITTMSATRDDVEIEGVEGLTAATVTVTGMQIPGAPGDSPRGGQSSTIIAGEVDGVRFQVSGRGAGGVDEAGSAAVVEDVARRQVAKIREAQ